MHKVSGHFCQCWNPWAPMLASNFRRKFVSFDLPFTSRGWLRSASYFGKMRFGWSLTFHFSTSKTFILGTNLPFLEELWFFGCNRQIRLEKWFSKVWFSALYDFWQRGKNGTHHFWSWPSAKNDFTTFGSWLEDTCVLARRHMCAV